MTTKLSAAAARALLVPVLLILATCATEPESAPPPAHAPTPVEPPPRSAGVDPPPEEALPDYSEVPKLVVEWERPVGDSVGEALAYDAATETLYVGTRTGYVLAVEGATGKNRWVHNAVGEVSSAPAFDDNRVYVGFREPGGAVALDKETGRLLWRTVAVGWVARDPVVMRNIVLFVSDNLLLALSPRTGERLARYDLSVPRSAELNNLAPLGEGVVASYSSDEEAGVVVVPRIRNTSTLSYALEHEVADLTVMPHGGVVVHGPEHAGEGTVLTVLEAPQGAAGVAESGKSDRADTVSKPFHEGSRLLGFADGNLLMTTAPSAVTAFTATPSEGLTRHWQTRRHNAGVEAEAWAPSGLPVSGSAAVTGRGLEGVVGYEPTSGEILYHFEIEEGAVIRGIAAGAERLYLLISTATGGQARLVALATAGR